MAYIIYDQYGVFMWVHFHIDYVILLIIGEEKKNLNQIYSSCMGLTMIQLLDTE